VRCEVWDALNAAGLAYGIVRWECWRLDVARTEPGAYSSTFRNSTAAGRRLIGRTVSSPFEGTRTSREGDKLAVCRTVRTVAEKRKGHEATAD